MAHRTAMAAVADPARRVLDVSTLAVVSDLAGRGCTPVHVGRMRGGRGRSLVPGLLMVPRVLGKRAALSGRLGVGGVMHVIRSVVIHGMAFLPAGLPDSMLLRRPPARCPRCFTREDPVGRPLGRAGPATDRTGTERQSEPLRIAPGAASRAPGTMTPGRSSALPTNRWPGQRYIACSRAADEPLVHPIHSSNKLSISS